jgi:hypothetical protein
MVSCPMDRERETDTTRMLAQLGTVSPMPLHGSINPIAEDVKGEAGARSVVANGKWVMR